MGHLAGRPSPKWTIAAASSSAAGSEPQRREARDHAEPPHRSGQGAAAPTRRHQRRRQRELRRRCARADGFRLSRLRASRTTSSTCRIAGSATRGPYSQFRTWGPIVQAVAGSRSSSGFPACLPQGGAIPTWIITAATSWRSRSSPRWSIATARARANGSTCACTEAGVVARGPACSTTRSTGGRCVGRDAQSNRSQFPRWRRMASTRRGDDEWVASRVATTTTGSAWVRSSPSRG